MDVLYKYVSAERALTCIPEVGNGTLRATQPAALNDPFEGAITVLYVVPDDDEEDRQLAEFLTEINDNKPVTAEDVRNARREHGSLFRRQLFTQQTSTRLGIISFATEPRHPLMWSHYTTDGSGFAIGYDVDELRKLAGPGGLLTEVRYGDSLIPFIGPIGQIIDRSNVPLLLSVKSDHWSYEKEWRLVVELDRTVGTGQTDRHEQPINLVPIPNEAVVSVHYTERTPRQALELIRDRLADKNNRYRAGEPRKLILSSTFYGYVDAPDENNGPPPATL